MARLGYAGNCDRCVFCAAALGSGGLDNLRSAYRYNDTTGNRFIFIGFRAARTLD